VETTTTMAETMTTTAETMTTTAETTTTTVETITTTADQFQMATITNQVQNLLATAVLTTVNYL